MAQINNKVPWHQNIRWWGLLLIAAVAFFIYYPNGGLIWNLIFDFGLIFSCVQFVRVDYFKLRNKEKVLRIILNIIVIVGYLLGVFMALGSISYLKNKFLFSPAPIVTEEPFASTNINNASNRPQPVNLNNFKVADTQAANETKILAVISNDQADSQGTVKENKNIFPPATLKIYVSAYIEKAQKDQVVSAYLVYNPTGDEVGPVSNVSKQSGNIISNFSFTKPAAGWPIGDYLIKISLADGQSKESTFTIK